MRLSFFYKINNKFDTYEIINIREEKMTAIDPKNQTQMDSVVRDLYEEHSGNKYESVNVVKGNKQYVERVNKTGKGTPILQVKDNQLYINYLDKLSIGQKLLFFIQSFFGVGGYSLRTVRDHIKNNGSLVRFIIPIDIRIMRHNAKNFVHYDSISFDESGKAVLNKGPKETIETGILNKCTQYIKDSDPKGKKIIKDFMYDNIQENRKIIYTYAKEYFGKLKRDLPNQIIDEIVKEIFLENLGKFELTIETKGPDLDRAYRDLQDQYVNIMQHGTDTIKNDVKREFERVSQLLKNKS
jgi:hypothetical protein